MKIRKIIQLLGFLVFLVLQGCASTVLRGTGDLGVVIERAQGSVQIIDTSNMSVIMTVNGLGDLSHASVVYSRDARYAYVFGRDGGISKIDLLTGKLDKRIIQAGNSIGGAISQNGKLLASQNYSPGGVKVFSADTLELLADIPAIYGDAETRSKVVGLVDAPDNKFVWSLFDANEIWVGDFTDPKKPNVHKFLQIGQKPYDGLITPNGRYYMAGLFGDDGLALLDLWHPEKGVRRILDGYGQGQQKLPVYKMPHLRGWAVAGRYAYLPSIGHHEVLVLDLETWKEAGRIKVSGQPVFVIARPDGRQVWVNFAFPDNDKIDVVDVESQAIIRQLMPGKAILHMEFTPRGESVWVSARDSNHVVIYDTKKLLEEKIIPSQSPSGIFFTNRAMRIGF